MELNPVIIWFIIGLALMLLEFAVPGVVLVFFGVAAWVVSLTTYLGLTTSPGSQMLLFSVATVLLLVGLRKWVRQKLFMGHVSGSQNLDEDLDEFTGKEVTVLADIAPGGAEGKVEFKGADWKARSQDKLEQGDRAVITGIDGLVLTVKKS